MSNDNSPRAHSHRSLIRSSSIIALGTLASRVLGFLRDVLLAKILGTGFQADALFVAFRIPNMFRDLVGEGATNAAVVPVLSDVHVNKDRREFWQFVSVLLVLVMVILSVLTLAGMVLAPLIVRLIAPGFSVDPDKLTLTIQLTRILFPYLLFIGMTAYGIAILYTFRSFLAPSFSPCLLNLATIVSAVLSPRYLEEPVYGLAAGILVGGVLQLLILVKPLRAAGIHWQWPRKLQHPAVAQVGRLLVPRMFGAAVYQLNILVDTLCASLSTVVGQGGVSAIYFANRVVQFPMGVFGLALASAALPTLSTLMAQKDTAQFTRTLVFSLENIFFVLLPSSMFLVVLSRPVVRVLFQRGEFNAYSTDITSSALLFYALGLAGFGCVKIMVTSFYAMQDTRTPVKVASVCLLINATLNVLLMGPMKIGGIALASAITSLVNVFWLLRLIQKKIGGLEMDGFFSFLRKTLFAVVVTGVLARLAAGRFPPQQDLLALIVVGAGGTLVYLAVGYVLGIDQARRILCWRTRRD